MCHQLATNLYSSSAESADSISILCHQQDRKGKEGRTHYFEQNGYFQSKKNQNIPGQLFLIFKMMYNNLFSSRVASLGIEQNGFFTLSFILGNKNS